MSDAHATSEDPPDPAASAAIEAILAKAPRPPAPAAGTSWIEMPRSTFDFDDLYGRWP